VAPLSAALPLNRAGAVVRIDSELRFLSADLLRRFVPPPQLSDVPGTGLTMALVDGHVLAIIALGPRSSVLTVCEVAGELVGLLGAEPEAAGFFEADGSGVRFRGQRAAALDVTELVRASARGAAEPEALG
jgi:hypothetical protein